MISEAVHRGETVYNVALRIDPNSLMRAAAFQLFATFFMAAERSLPCGRKTI